MGKSYLSPGVGYTEVEEALTRREYYEPIIAIVGGAVKGPTEVTVVRTQRELKYLFGLADPNDYGVLAADYLLAEKCTVLYKRVMGESAAKGTAGAKTSVEETPADMFTFETKEYTADLNGYIVSVEYSDEKETVNYTLKNGDTVVETYKELSINPESDRYICKILEERGLYINAIKTDGVSEPVTANLTIRGGDNGIASLTTKNYIDAVKEFSNPEVISFTTIICPGQTDSGIIDAYSNLAKTRGDCMYIADIPFGTTPATALDFVDGKSSGDSNKLDNQYVAVFGPWVKINDGHGAKVWCPPSAIAIRVWTQSDNITNGCWFAAAGFSDNRGVVPEAVEVEYGLTKDDRDKWLGDNNVLNPICNFNGLGIAVFGNKTTRRTPVFEEESVFCSIHIRRLANYIKQIVIKISLTELFNPNDSITWASWKAKVSPKLKEIKDARGLVDYKVVMDETTVTEEDIRNGQAPAVIYVKPVRAIEWIPITFTVTENSVIFDEGEEV